MEVTPHTPTAIQSESVQAVYLALLDYIVDVAIQAGCEQDLPDIAKLKRSALNKFSVKEIAH